MRVKRCFSIAMLIVGTVIGAGFASGAEIVSFFGRNGISPFVALLCVPLVAGGCMLFLFLGSRFKPRDIGRLNSLVLGKAGKVADGFLLVNALIVSAGMLAAFDSIGRSLVGFPMFSIVFGLLAALVVSRGIGGVIKVNAVALPAVVVALLFVCGASFNPALLDCDLFSLRPVGALIYISMNMVLAAGALTSVHDLKKSEIVFSSAVAAVVIGALMTAIILALNSTGKFYCELPTLEMARELNPLLFYVMVAGMSVSVFTTLLTAMNCLTDYVSGITRGRKLAVFIVLAVSLLLSVLGFERVVGALYPLIGALGGVYVIVNFVFAVRVSGKDRRAGKGLPARTDLLFDERHRKIHERRKHAQNDRRSHDEV